MQTNFCGKLFLLKADGQKHSQKKRKDNLETRAVFSWILILTWILGGMGGAILHQSFLK